MHNHLPDKVRYLLLVAKMCSNAVSWHTDHFDNLGSCMLSELNQRNTSVRVIRTSLQLNQSNQLIHVNYCH